MAAVATVAAACAAPMVLPGTAQAARPAPHTVRVSTASDGTQLDGPSRGGAISADGRYVAFWSAAPSMGGGKYNYLLLFKNLQTGEVRKVPGVRSDTGGYAVKSSDGRYVGHSQGSYYPSAAVYDRDTGLSTRINDTRPSSVGSFSADGQLVAVTAGSRTPSRPYQLFIHDLRSGTDEQIDLSQTPHRYESAAGGKLSADGDLVAFAAGPRELRDVFVKNRRTGRLEQIDVPQDGVPDEARSSATDISDDGRYVLFDSDSTNLAPGRTEPGGHYSYLRDRRTGKTQRIGGDGWPAKALSGDGRKVLLSENGRLAVLDLRTGKRSDAGPGSYTAAPSLTARGDAVIFTSDAADLVPEDTNDAEDVFVRHLR